MQYVLCKYIKCHVYTAKKVTYLSKIISASA